MLGECRKSHCILGRAGRGGVRQTLHDLAPTHLSTLDLLATGTAEEYERPEGVLARLQQPPLPVASPSRKACLSSRPPSQTACLPTCSLLLALLSSGGEGRWVAPIRRRASRLFGASVVPVSPAHGSSGFRPTTQHHHSADLPPCTPATSCTPVPLDPPPPPSHPDQTHPSLGWPVSSWSV